MASSQVESSRSVSSVQELVKSPLITIPKDFLGLNQEPPARSDGTVSPALPIIDLDKLVSGQVISVSELEKLHSTCKEWGFFQLVNHGVNSSLLHQLEHEIEKFYELPLEEKAKYKVRPGDFEGYGTTARSEGKLEWGDKLFMITNPIHNRKPHLFPELPSSFRNTLETYLSELQKLGMKLLGFLAVALKMDTEEMEELFEDGMQSVRMTYYPPCPQPELVVGITPHSDATGITILHQVNGVDGLEIKKDGVWFPVSFLPHALIVNVGDVLEILSNGVYSSIEHRATVNSIKERISVAFFINPKLDAEIGPAKNLISPQNHPLYKRVTMEKYIQDFLSRVLKGKSYLEYMKIQGGESNTS